MNDILNTLSRVRTNVLVKELDKPINIEVKGNSETPDLIILNGTVSEKDFEDAKRQIKNGGIIAFTRGNSSVCSTIEQGIELYGDAYRVIASCLKNGEYVCLVKGVLIYIKGVSIKKATGAHDWAISKKKGAIESLLFHNLGAKLKNFIFEEEEETEKPKRKRRSKAEMKEAEESKD